jgi:hypothetical protein
LDGLSVDGYGLTQLPCQKWPAKEKRADVKPIKKCFEDLTRNPADEKTIRLLHFAEAK